ncbi:hypothetical protein VCRA2112O187_1030002 [Vibrio crassostreae]|nr:hypothetical protein VCRA2112O187_1030002 [Vibrio crassostreae]
MSRTYLDYYAFSILELPLSTKKTIVLGFIPQRVLLHYLGVELTFEMRS